MGENLRRKERVLSENMMKGKFRAGLSLRLRGCRIVLHARRAPLGLLKVLFAFLPGRFLSPHLGPKRLLRDLSVNTSVDPSFPSPSVLPALCDGTFS